MGLIERERVEKDDNGNGKSNNGAGHAGSTEVVKLGARLERAVDSVDHLLASGKNITLDFSDCDFITVEGLEWLEEMLLRSESQQTKVTFVKLKPKIYKVFKVAHIDSIQKACGAPSSTIGPAC